MSKTSKKETVRVTLVLPHKHGGEQLKTGDTLDVTPERKAWLQRHGVVSKDATTTTQQED